MTEIMSQHMSQINQEINRKAQQIMKIKQSRSQSWN